MNTKGLVSIIVPCYNGARYIERFMRSILAQTYKHCELIIINDGSTDNSGQVIKEYEAVLNANGISLKYISHNNSGLGVSIQKGLNAISGEFFTWFGIDDWPRYDYMEKAIKYLGAYPEYGVVRFDGYLVDPNDTSKIIERFAKNNHDKWNTHLFENAVNEVNFHFGYSVVRTAYFEKSNRGRTIYPSREGQNWQILLPVIYFYKAGFIDEPLYYVIEHQNSLSRCAKSYEARIKQIEEYQNILIQTISHMEIPDKEKYLSLVRDRYAHRIFRWALGHDDYPKARECYKYLKHEHILTIDEKKQYFRCFWKIEYWLYLKHRWIK